jgi:hypothetical protein
MEKENKKYSKGVWEAENNVWCPAGRKFTNDLFSTERTLVPL